MDAQQSAGFVIWLTGMERAGKSSLAGYVARRLTSVGRKVELLDGDEPGQLLTAGLGPSKEDREMASRRVALVAKLLARNGVAAICAAVSPFRETREAIRKEIRRMVEVFVDCPMETLLARDAGGLYAKALNGEVRNVVGIDDPYEPPSHAEVVVHSNQETIEQEGARVFQALLDLKYIGPTEYVRLTGQRPRRSKPARAARKGAHRKMAAKAAARKVPKKMAARTAKANRRARR